MRTPAITCGPDHYDRDAADMLAVQDEIVRAIATRWATGVEAAGRERALRFESGGVCRHTTMCCAAKRSCSASPEGRQLPRPGGWRKRGRARPQERAGACPTWVDPLHGLLSAAGSKTACAALDAAFAVARRAVLLDDADCRARWLLGDVHVYRREFDEACAHLRRAIALNPERCRSPRDLRLLSDCRRRDRGRARTIRHR